jgi:uncharacterized repeat protein (TIGR04076 family)
MAESLVRVKVLSQKGHCEAGHKVGDEWLVGEKTPEGMCIFAFASLLPFITPLMFGGAFPWEKDADKTTAVCPDPDNPVIFEIRRVRD